MQLKAPNITLKISRMSVLLLKNLSTIYITKTIKPPVSSHRNFAKRSKHIDYFCARTSEKEASVPVVALTSDVTSEIAEFADITLDIGSGKERVGYVTKGFTATVLTLMLTGLHLHTKQHKLMKPSSIMKSMHLAEQPTQSQQQLPKQKHFMKDGKRNSLLHRSLQQLDMVLLLERAKNLKQNSQKLSACHHKVLI